MVRLTDDAASLLRRIQAGQENVALRVVTESGELVIGKSATAADDEVVLHEGSPVLSMSAEAADMLAGSTIGIEQTGGGPVLQIIPSEPAGS
jgi:hypothetical protein